MRPTAKWLGHGSWVFPCIALSACSSDRKGNEPHETNTTAEPASTSVVAPKPQSAHVSAPFDLQAVMQQVHFAFRLENGRYQGGDGPYRATVDERGVIAVVPRDTREGAATQFETATVSFDETAGWARDTAPRVAEDGGVDLDHGAVVEHLRNTEDGVEQSWTMKSKPATGQAVTVRVRVSGTRYRGDSREGLHFVDDRTGLGLRYSWATWVDAQGSRTEVRGRWNGEEIVMQVPAEIVNRSRFPATLDPLISPEFGIDQPIPFANAWTSTSPSVAYGGGLYVVAWNDTHSMPSTSVARAARVRSDGTVLDPGGVSLGSHNSWSFRPKVASNGSGFCIVVLNGGSSTGEVVRFGIDGSRASVSSLANVAYGADINSDGNGYLIAQSYYVTNGQQLNAALLSASCATSSSFQVASYVPSYSLRNPAVGFDGSNYVITATGVSSASPPTYAPYLFRVSPSGAVLGAGNAVAVATTTDTSSTLSFDGANMLVAFGAPSGIMARRYDKLGSAVDPAAFTVASTGVAVNPLDAVFDGTSHLIATGAWISRVHPDKTIASNVVVGAQALATDGAQSLAVVDGVRGVRFKPDGTILDSTPFPIAGKPISQKSPSLAFNGSNYLVVWSDNRFALLGDTQYFSSYGSIFAARITQAGTVLDPSGIQLTNALYSKDVAPAVASDGNGYLTVWTSANGIRAARVSSDGEVLDKPVLSLSNSGLGEPGPRVAFGGGTYMAVWGAGTAPNTSLTAARVKADGSLPDAAGISIGAGTGGNLAFDGTNYLVVWSTGNGSLNAARLGPGGNLLDPTPKTIGTSIYSYGAPAIAYDGTNYLAVWGTSDIAGIRIAPGGMPVDASPFVISAAPGQQSSPALVWDGFRYVVAWQDARTGLDIYGTRVTSTGDVMDGAGVPLSSDAAQETQPSLASTGAGQVLLAYTKSFDQTDQYTLHTRTRSRIGRFGAGTGADCAISADCQSGHCVDSVCCDSACSGLCEACSAATKASGDADGTCGPAKSNTDPHNSCKDDGSPGCGKNGLCDGAGSCQFYTVSPGCAPSSCASGSDCASGFCADGICCDSACTGPCVSCRASVKGSGTDGECGAILAGTDPENECTKDPGYPNSCLADGMCNGAGECRAFAPSSVVCGASSCSNGSVTGFHCNAAGQCISGTTGCAPYLCKGDACSSTCTSDIDCSTGNFCKNGACVSLLSNGSACSEGGQCISKTCVEGVCCDSVCDGACQSCLASNKASGATGQCGPIKANVDPKAACPADTVNTCGSDGLCDGLGSCRLYAPSGLGCGSGATCQGNSMVGNACNGQGVCLSGAAIPCAPYLCKAGACLLSCSIAADCSPGNTCVSGQCVGKSADGMLCSVNAECLSGFCAGGVCCDSVCDGGCESCKGLEKASGSSGICGPIKANTDPRNACESDGTPCGANGLCNGLGTCAAVAPVNQVCGASTCVGEQLAAQLCDGKGSCGTVPTACAGGFVCKAGACLNTCANDSDCASGYRCGGQACVPLKDIGGACTYPTDCKSGFCVDSVCCDSPCTGQCEACDQSGKLGKCLPVTGTPHGNRQKCVTDESDCKGACDGADTTECKYPGAATYCATTACDGNVFKPVVCDGHGACKALATQPCENYACDLGLKACKTKCTSTKDCASGAECDVATGQCAAGGGTCKDDFTIKSPGGAESSCTPYKCNSGVCRDSCSTANDCAPGYACSGSKCVLEGADGGSAATTEVEQDKGCGCGVVGHTPRDLKFALMALLAAGLVRRRMAR